MGVYTTINDPSAHFHTQLYTGNGSELAVTNNANSGNFQPDWIWIKDRSAGSSNHFIQNTSRTITKRLETNTTAAEANNSQDVKSVQSNGFTVGNNAGCNTNTNLHAAWQWKINGGTTSSVGTGSITTTVQANTTAGVSIVLYQGNGVSGATIGHGLGKVPKIIIVKCREATESWQVYHGARGTPQNKFIELDANSTGGSNSNRWNNTAPTTSVISLGNGNSVNYSGRIFQAICFAEIQGFSNFGVYKGNGDADGPFVNTGFKPAWVMIKRFDSTGNWYIYDTTRNGSSGPNTNQAHRILYANDGSGEVNNSDRGIDMVSNGFKLRNTLGNTNEDDGQYGYFAFASSPFVSSAGVPTTAR